MNASAKEEDWAADEAASASGDSRVVVKVEPGLGRADAGLTCSATALRFDYTLTGTLPRRRILGGRGAALTSCSPQTEWEEGDSSDGGLFSSPKADGAAPTAASGGKGDEMDPLGLMRGGVLA